MQSANISTKTLDGNSQIFELVAQEYTDNGDTLNGKIGVDDNRGAIQQPSIYNRTNNASGIEFRNNGDSLCLNANGVTALQCESTYVYPNKPIYLGDGLLTNPQLSLLNAQTTGFFRVGTSALGLGVSSANHTHFHSAYTEHFQQSRFPNGTVSAPSISFTNDTDCGLYRAGSNDIRMSANGTDVTGYTANNFVLYKSLSSGYQSCFVFSKSGATDRLQLTSNTWNNIDFPNVFSQGSDITRTTSPNIRYTINTGGRYLIIYTVSLTVDSTTNRLNYSIIRKNDDDGNDKRFAYNMVNPVINSAQSGMTASCILDLSTNDFLKMMIYPTGYAPYCPYGTSYADFLSIYRLC